MNQIYIFGAHSRARTLKEYLEKSGQKVQVCAFLFDNEEENPQVADGIPVLDLRSADICENLDASLTVYLGIKGINQEKATAHLQDLGFTQIIPLTVSLDTQLRNQYVKAVFEKNKRVYIKLDDLLEDNTTDYNSQSWEMALYVAASVFDGTLREQHVFQPFEKVIQVGCALTEMRLNGAIYDDEGDSISDRNKQFCELTALYWIWKNAKEDYVGLEHYRRFFTIPQNIAQVMSGNDVDVILPIPLYVAPSVEENYIFRHEPKVWEDMMDVLRKQNELEYVAAKAFFAQGLYSPCNMLIARKEVFDHLCEWMFPILFSVAEQNGLLEDRYQNRYPGFLSERLISFYFDLHKDDYKVVYADKVFLM